MQPGGGPVRMVEQEAANRVSRHAAIMRAHLSLQSDFSFAGTARKGRCGNAFPCDMFVNPNEFVASRAKSGQKKRHDRHGKPTDARKHIRRA
jgi:hypothetical protein